MTRLFWGNFEFEEELALRQNLPPRLARLNAELACCWMAIAEEGDRIWCPHAIGREFFAVMRALGLREVRTVADAKEVSAADELVPWGWTDRAWQFAGRVAATSDVPPLEAVRRANSRRFSLSCEIEWGAAPDGVSAVESVTELDEAVRRTVATGRGWVLKSEFSHAARHRLRGTGPLTADPVRWAAKRLESDGVLFFEPWFERIAEAGFQWTVPRTGPPVFEGVTPLLTEAQGRYCGSVFGVGAEELRPWQPAVELSELAVRRLQELGYHGPVGIDAMRFRNRVGEERIRPLQDINARWTMGRLSIGWSRIASSGVWRHGTRRQFAEASAANPQQCVATSPQVIAGQPVEHVTWIEYVHER
jgi:hypothetical protein